MKIKKMISEGFTPIVLTTILTLFGLTLLARDYPKSEIETSEETLIWERIKAEQKSYFQNLESSKMRDQEFEMRANSCKYISSIFTPAIQRTVHLTFDDGPHPTLTPQLLDLLMKENIQVTFFVLGKNVVANKSVLQRARAEGHLIASHSFDHPDFHTLTEADQINQISTTDQLLTPYFQAPKLFRYPYGNSTCFSNQKNHSMNYQGIIGWHIDSCDWAFAANGGFVTDKQAQICEVKAANKANFAAHVLEQVEQYNGGVILMHDIHKNTVDNVQEIIFRLRKAGYSFMNLDDPRTQIFYQ